MSESEAIDDDAATSVAVDDVEAPAPTGPIIVGIGASAGGLTAYQEFFGAMPADSGMAFVLVQHLDPTFNSALAEILSACTAMPVTQAVEGTVAAANTVSVIPPNTILKIEGGVLRLAEPETETARRSSVDIFLTSLAQDQRENAVGIILSGFGSDGTAGVAAIKEYGGLTLSEAEFDHQAKAGMPHSAVSSGLVDDVLQPHEMPAALLEYARNKIKLDDQISADAAGKGLAAHLKTICSVVHSRLGRDFGLYKTSTLLRRVRRRMQVLRIETPGAYVEHLRSSGTEPDLLFREMLISVTRFFRDPTIFETLAKTVIPELLATGDPQKPVRIWVAGCATGEEAYSLAILFREAAIKADSARPITIFATDLDDRAVTIARAGLYSDAIEAEISPDRLERHFTNEGGRYRVAKHIREMCLFSTHDLVKDPPFSRLDMVSCRNLLIYFESQLQQRVMTTFHYALNAKGVLFLGPSENIIVGDWLFQPINKRGRLFRRLDTKAEVPRLGHRARIGRAAVPTTVANPVTLNDHASRIASTLIPAYIVVNGRDEILRFSGPVGKYIEPVSGGATLDLFQMLHPELRSPTRALLRRAMQEGKQVREHREFYVANRLEAVNLIAAPMTEVAGEMHHLLLAFQEVETEARTTSPARKTDPRSEEHGELLAAREQLQTVTEELETANEELQSSNEEFQSVNEELHSTVEELETSKEELQSINEELHTVNAELNTRAESLVRTNSDLINLFDSTSIATLFLDTNHSIRRFTPAIGDIFNVRAGDEGRSIKDFSSRLNTGDLEAEAAAAVKNLSTTEREMESTDGTAAYVMRIKPYRDLNNVIDGVVITFIDITQRRRHERDRSQLAAIVESSEDAIIGHGLDGTITSWNRSAEKIFGYTAGEIVGQPMSTLLSEAQFDDWPANLRRLQQGEVLKKLDMTRLTKSGQSLEVSLSVSPILDGAGNVVGGSAVARDITERKAAEAQAALLMAELDHRVKNILSVVSSVVSQTLKPGGSVEQLRLDIDGRIKAVARAHSLLTRGGSKAGSLLDLVKTEMAPYDQGANIEVGGDDVLLSSATGLTLALALHELATNAAKYGALSVPEGHLKVTWNVEGQGDDQTFSLIWHETGGPPLKPPTERGFGTKLIEIAVAHGLGATVTRDFRPTGVYFQIKAPFEEDIGTLREPKSGGEQ